MTLPAGIQAGTSSLLFLLGNPLISPVIAKLYDVVVVTKANFTLAPRQEMEAVSHHSEAGIIRAAFLSTDNPKTRYHVIYEVRPGLKVEWDFSAEELTFLGLDENTGVGPYVTEASPSKVNPWTGETVPVYSIYFPPLTQLTFYNGMIRASVKNPTTTTVRVWLLHFERYVIREAALKALEGLMTV